MTGTDRAAEQALAAAQGAACAAWDTRGDVAPLLRLQAALDAYRAVLAEKGLLLLPAQEVSEQNANAAARALARHVRHPLFTTDSGIARMMTSRTQLDMAYSTAVTNLRAVGGDSMAQREIEYARAVLLDWLDQTGAPGPQRPGSFG